jgi:hypothetical protein
VRRSEVYTKLWPLLHYRRSHRGEREFQMLSPLWTRDPGAFRAHYGPFVSLVRFTRDYRGRKDLTLLFGLIRNTSDHVRRHREFNCLGLVDYRRHAPDRRQTSLLFGCFGRERFGRQVVWRFLWIPFGHISRAERQAAMLAEEREMRYRARAEAAGLPWDAAAEPEQVK